MPGIHFPPPKLAVSARRKILTGFVLKLLIVTLSSGNFFSLHFSAEFYSFFFTFYFFGDFGYKHGPGKDYDAFISLSSVVSLFLLQGDSRDVAVVVAAH